MVVAEDEVCCVVVWRWGGWRVGKNVEEEQIK
jgi:hypothetical protein